MERDYPLEKVRNFGTPSQSLAPSARSAWFGARRVYNIFLMNNVSGLALVPIIAFSYLIIQITGLYNMMIYQNKKSVALMVINLMLIYYPYSNLLNFLLFLYNNILYLQSHIPLYFGMFRKYV